MCSSCLPFAPTHDESQGLNERFSGSSAGAVFGDGIYLAEDCGKADQYVDVDAAWDAESELHKRLYGRTQRHPGSVFYMLVCRVAIGAPIRTQQRGETATSMDTKQKCFPVTVRELADIPGVSPPIFHHSLVAELGSAIVRYREVIVFHGEYVMPQFLLAYQRCSGNDVVRARGQA